MDDSRELLLTVMVNSMRETSRQIAVMAEERFKLSPVDSLGWMHKYQAMYFSILADNVEAELKEISGKL